MLLRIYTAFQDVSYTAIEKHKFAIVHLRPWWARRLGYRHLI